mmetsp:Transcript_18292/g.39457  ORF Transcript_18292/g.39457 Transcript_18292/m.39457 type:complete len:345 (+) Transcript_18292:1500-2534(+)
MMPSSLPSSSTTGSLPMDLEMRNSSSSWNGMSGGIVGTCRRIHALTRCAALPACAAFTTSLYLSAPMSFPPSSTTGMPLRCVLIIWRHASSMVSSGPSATTDFVIISLAVTCSGTCASSASIASSIALSALAQPSGEHFSSDSSRMDAAAAEGWPPPSHLRITDARSTVSARGPQRPMSERNCDPLPVSCATPSSTQSKPPKSMSSSATRAMPVTKSRPVCKNTFPNRRPRWCVSSARDSASVSMSLCSDERRACPNSATAVCEAPCCISQTSAMPSRGVVSAYDSAPVSARMPSASNVASASDSLASGKSETSRSFSTSTVVAEPVGSMMSSSGEMLHSLDTW